MDDMEQGDGDNGEVEGFTREDVAEVVERIGARIKEMIKDLDSEMEVPPDVQVLVDAGDLLVGMAEMVETLKGLVQASAAAGMQATHTAICGSLAFKALWNQLTLQEAPMNIPDVMQALADTGAVEDRDYDPETDEEFDDTGVKGEKGLRVLELNHWGETLMRLATQASEEGPPEGITIQ